MFYVYNCGKTGQNFQKRLTPRYSADVSLYYEAKTHNRFFRFIHASATLCSGVRTVRHWPVWHGMVGLETVRRTATMARHVLARGHKVTRTLRHAASGHKDVEARGHQGTRMLRHADLRTHGPAGTQCSDSTDFNDTSSVAFETCYTFSSEEKISFSHGESHREIFVLPLLMQYCRSLYPPLK